MLFWIGTNLLSTKDWKAWWLVWSRIDRWICSKLTSDLTIWASQVDGSEAIGDASLEKSHSDISVSSVSWELMKATYLY